MTGSAHRSCQTIVAPATQRVPLQLALAVLLAMPSQAGPCTADVDHLQGEIDARLDAVAGMGRSGQESIDARLHHEPTPESIARAERELAEGLRAREAAAELDRARTADADNDALGCERALEQVRRSLGR